MLKRKLKKVEGVEMYLTKKSRGNSKCGLLSDKEIDRQVGEVLEALLVEISEPDQDVVMDLRFIAAMLGQSSMVLIEDGKFEVMRSNGGPTLSKLRELCRADYVTYLGASSAFLKLAGIKTNAVIICDEEGQCRHGVNKLASRLLGDGIWGNKLYGPVIVDLQT